MKTFDKETELKRIQEKAAQEAQNAENKALAISVLPPAILDHSEYVHTGIYKDVLASVSLKVDTLAQAIELMETSNAIVGMVHAKGTFTTFCEADSIALNRNHYTTIMQIQPYVLELDYLSQYGQTVKLRWYAEYGPHRFRFETKITNQSGLPRYEIEWGGDTFGRELYVKSYRVVNNPPGSETVRYASGSNENPGKVIVYFPLSDNTAAEDFRIGQANAGFQS